MKSKDPTSPLLPGRCPADVEKALTVLARARRPYLHIFMGVSPEFLRHVLKIHEGEALAAVADCVRTAKSAGVRVQFSLSEAPHAPHEFLLSVFACRPGMQAPT